MKKKIKLKPLSGVIQICPRCGKVDVYKNDGHLCLAKKDKRKKDK